METVVLTNELQVKLASLTEPVLLTDASGKPLGHYVPGRQYDHLLYRLAEAQCPYSEEEMHQMSQAKGGRPLAEILKKLHGQ